MVARACSWSHSLLFLFLFFHALLHSDRRRMNGTVSNAINPGNVYGTLRHHGIEFNESAVLVMSNESIPIYVRFIASLGRSFNHHVPLSFSAAVGSCITACDVLRSCDNFPDLFYAKHEFNELKCSIFNQTVMEEKLSPAQSYIASLAKLTEIFLSTHKGVIIVQADKGGRSVIMDKKDYIKRIGFHVDSCIANGNYAEIIDLTADEITISVERRYKTIISEINPFLLTDLATNEPLRQESFSIPLFYGTIKVHKPGMPVRPIIASCNMIGDRLSTWLLQKLYIVSDHFNKFSVNSAVKVISDLRSFHIEDGHVLCSLDYESMYTNVDVEATISIITEYYHLIEPTTTVPCVIFIRCLRFFTSDSAYFSAIGRLFSQIKGLAMGNRLAQVLAAIRTDYALVNALRDMDASIMSFLYKYVDDIFSSIRIDHVRRICDSISECTGMNVTVEYENELNEIAFLDCSFKRELDNSVSYKWFTKECSASRTLNFHSHHPWHMKRNCVTNLVRSAILRTSTQQLHLTFTKLETIIKNSSYPIGYIHRVFQEVSNQRAALVQTEVQNSTTNESSTSRYVSCPLYEPISERIESVTTTLSIPVTLSHRPLGKNKDIMFAKLKDTVPLRFKKNCLFRVECLQCEFSCNLTATSINVQTTINRAMKFGPSLLCSHIKNNPGHQPNHQVKLIHTFRNVYEANRSYDYVSDVSALYKRWKFT